MDTEMNTDVSSCAQTYIHTARLALLEGLGAAVPIAKGTSVFQILASKFHAPLK